MTSSSGIRWLLAVLMAALPWSAGADRSWDARDAGIAGDGLTVSTVKIQKAIDVCSAAGGGMINFPAGRYVTGTIQLKDNVTLDLDQGAILLGSTNAADYRNVDPFTDGTGRELGYALITAVGAHHIGIEGQGIIDGQGKALSATQQPYAVRPFLVRWVRCENISVREVQLRNSGAWTMHFFQTTNATVSGVSIRSQGLANNDGIDIDSCESVRVTNCDIETDDDSICLKTTSALPCRNVTIIGCRLKSRCAAFKMGTESLGDFEHIRISDCQIRDTRLGGIKLLSVDGANLRDVIASDISMDNVTVPIMMRLGARLKTFRAGDNKKAPGTLSNVTIKNLTATNASQIGILLSGIPGHKLEQVNFENVVIYLPGGGSDEDSQVQLSESSSAYPEIRMFGPKMPAYGIYARHVHGVVFNNVRTIIHASDARPEKVLLDVEDVTPADFAPAASK